MNYIGTNLYSEYFGIDKGLLEAASKIEDVLTAKFREIDKIRETNQLKVIASMNENKLSETHFNPTTGYGYGDRGREMADRVFASVFRAEAALVRQHIVNGTQAIALCLYACLRPGDELLSITGRLYDTLEETVGIRGAQGTGSLRDFGISYRQVDMLPDGRMDMEAAANAISGNTKVVYIQKSRGYTNRAALSSAAIGHAIEQLKKVKNDIIIIVDNCYGEFTETMEPVESGADLIAGSLIKNPGGGIAPAGGYIAGKADLVEKAACRFTCPGIGAEAGADPYGYRLIFQGLFMAPYTVAESLKGAIFCASMMEHLGFDVDPRPSAERYDIIQSIIFNNPDSLISFCRGIQKASAVDSFVVPEPWEMPGYDSKVIMAAGCFVQGASSELSADGPLRPPYTAYMQGGLVYAHCKLGVLLAAQNLLKTER